MGLETNRPAVRSRIARARWVQIGCASSFLLLAECGKARWDSPVDAYTSFTRAVHKGDYKAAYANLASPTQRLLAERTHEVSRASAGAIRDDPAALTFSAAPRPEPLTEVKLVTQDAGRATLIASSSNASAEILIVREAGGWKVDLTQAIQSRIKANP